MAAPLPPDRGPASAEPPLSRRGFLVAGAVMAAGAVAASRVGTADTSDATTTDTTVRVGADRAASAPGTPPTLAGAEPAPPAGYAFERVIAGGRVIDPDSGWDATADVGIDGGTVRAISTTPLTGKERIDAAGQVVAPGFIDILSYEPNDLGSWFKLADGVTTNLGMHGVKDEPDHFFTRYGTNEPVPPVNYGAAFENNYMRHDANGFGQRPLNEAELDRYLAQLDEHLHQGWLGVDCEPEYNPWVPTSELSRMGEVAARAGVPFFWHVRYSSPDEKGADGAPHDNATALAEVLQVARETGVAVHVDHITSTGGTHTMPQSLETLEKARAEGIDVTACLYPYDFWATTVASNRFAPGWQERFRISYDDLVVPGTGERLNEQSFRRAVSQNLLVAAYAIPEEDIRTALRTPWVMLGSDAILVPRAGGRPNNHPRAAGTFTRVLGHYVREEQVLSLNDALAKMTILPARRLEAKSPDMRRKGRLQVGADADIVVFDPATVTDKATIDQPDQMAVGMSHVLVAGQVVLGPQGPVRTVRPGRPVRSEI